MGTLKLNNIGIYKKWELFFPLKKIMKCISEKWKKMWLQMIQKQYQILDEGEMMKAPQLHNTNQK